MVSNRHTMFIFNSILTIGVLSFLFQVYFAYLGNQRLYPAKKESVDYYSSFY